jgi:hypothetical protein
VKWVRIKLAAEKTGYTEKAIRNKIQCGIWLMNVIWRKAPDGCIFINLEAVEKWVEGQAILPPQLFGLPVVMTRGPICPVAGPDPSNATHPRSLQSMPAILGSARLHLPRCHPLSSGPALNFI